MSIELYHDGEHRCIVFEDLVACEEAEALAEDACESVQANQFLIVNNGHAALIDPGGHLTYTRLFMDASDHINIKELDYVIASHQDPDVVSSLNRWLVGSDCHVVVPEIWRRFIPHFCNPGATRGRLIGIPDQGMNIRIGEAVIQAIPAHFLHSEGNFHFYDPKSKILFTGDMGASAVDADELGTPVEDFDAHIRHMERFHQRYMNSNKVARLWAEMVRKMDVEWIVPQHGPSFKGRKMVERFLDWISQLPCGVDLMQSRHYQPPALNGLTLEPVRRLAAS